MLKAVAGLLAALALTMTGPAAAAEPPRRVVSINLCADQLAVLLLPRERIAALSFLASDAQLSYVADRVAGIPVQDGSAERVLAARPDLVLAGRFTTRPTVALLKARGIPVLELDMPEDFTAIRAQLLEVAAVLGTPDRAQALLAEMEARLAAVPPPTDPRPRALAFQAAGFTAGAGTLTDAVMTAAGLGNYAAGLELSGYGYVAVETVAADPPDLILARSRSERFPSLATRLPTHPALARSPAARPEVPGALLACAGPFTAEAVTLLAQARAGLDARAQVAARSGPAAP